MVFDIKAVDYRLCSHLRFRNATQTPIPAIGAIHSINVFAAVSEDQLSSCIDWFKKRNARIDLQEGFVAIGERNIHFTRRLRVLDAIEAASPGK
jgi:hypothetical protein